MPKIKKHKKRITQQSDFVTKQNVLDLRKIGFAVKKITSCSVTKEQRDVLVKKDAEKYFEIHNSDKHALVKHYHKQKHFFGWAVKLLVPDFLIGHPNLWDNLKILYKSPNFKPLRMALVAWLIFILTSGSAGIYFLINSPSIFAADFADDTQVEFDTGTYAYTQWDGTNSWVEGTNTTPNPIWELPDNAATTGWQNMSGNVLMMHMNEASGTIEDTSGQNNDGTNNGATYSATGKLKTAMSFDGVDDYITIPDSDSLDVTSFTLSSWIYRKSSGSRSIIERGNYASPDYYAMTFSGDTLWLQSSNSYFAAGTIPLNKWVHVVGTLEGTTGRVYVNGVEVKTGTLNAPIAGSDSLMIGSRLGGRLFDGEIDEVAIFNRALSATEISNIYKQQSVMYSGTYTSEIKDVGDSAYNSIAWTPERPTGKELPDNAVSETAYTSGNANMTGNVLLMHMNDTNIGFVEDVSSNNNDGMALGGAETQADSGGPALGREAIFDGVNDYVEVGDVLDIGLDDLTSCAWIKMSGIGAYKGVVSKSYYGSMAGRWSMYMSNGKLWDSTRRRDYCGFRERWSDINP